MLRGHERRGAYDRGLSAGGAQLGDTNDGGARRGDRRNAVALAKTADVVIYVGGLSPLLEGEEMDVPFDGFDRRRPHAD